MQYLFILGRNQELSLAELKSFFGNFKYTKNKNAILAELPKLEKGIISRFGGIIAIGEVLVFIDDLEKNIQGKILYGGSENKFNYVVWDLTIQPVNLLVSSPAIKKKLTVISIFLMAYSPPF